MLCLLSATGEHGSEFRGGSQAPPLAVTLFTKHPKEGKCELHPWERINGFVLKQEETRRVISPSQEVAVTRTKRGLESAMWADASAALL